MSKCVKALIIINAGVFVLISLLPRFPWFFIFGLVPRFIFSKLMLWQPVTYLFIHANLWHLVINMLMLWFFGPAIEDSWGTKKFLSYYFFTGIGAALCSFITAMGSPVPVIGASGAIFGLLVAYAMMFPDTVILIFFFFPMRIRQAVIVMAVINLLGAISSTGGGIAYFAHLGGGLFGYLYFKSERLRFFLSALDIGYFRRYRQKQKEKRRTTQKKSDKEEVDAILDKISKQGMKSLSFREKDILKRESKRYKQ